MLRTILYSLKLLTLILLCVSNLYAEELTLIPLKKPVLDKITEQQKITQGVIRPKPKPINKIENKQISQINIIPESKPKREVEKIKTEIVEKEKKVIEVIIDKKVKKEKNKNSFLIPKSKPLVVKKIKTVIKKKSKYYSQKDFDIAKKSINAIEKRPW